ncbi:MAG: Crp/Fnr family transcriptional regulator [Nitrospirae bacterium]|nr:Crp/Fnr family transcriptional regulator [Nitrospirota bacterium]
MTEGNNRDIEIPMYLDHFKNISIFSSLSDDHLRIIQSNFRKMFVREGTVILQQNEQSFDLYTILSGKVRVSIINRDNREVSLAILKEGDFFGELSFLDKKPRSATVKAINEVKMLVLSRDAFLKILRENPDISINLLSGLAKRLRKADETIETLTFLDVSGRVAKILIDVANEQGEHLSDGFVAIECPTHQYIANQIGATRESVTKAMKSLKSKGLITMLDKDIVIAPNQFEIL